MSDDGLFTTYERLNTCRRTEVTVDNLHLLAQHFGATAVYTTNPRLIIPPVNEGGAERVAEVGSWIDERGSRWSPEPLSQGWSPAGTFVRAEERAECGCDLSGMTPPAVHIVDGHGDPVRTDEETP